MRHRALTISLLIVTIAACGFLACRRESATSPATPSDAPVELKSRLEEPRTASGGLQLAPCYDTSFRRSVGYCGTSCSSKSCDLDCYENQDASTVLSVESNGPAGGWCDESSFLIDFDTRDIPTNAVITTALLRLYAYDSGYMGPMYTPVSQCGSEALIPEQALPHVACADGLGSFHPFFPFEPGSFDIDLLEGGVTRVAPGQYSRYLADREVGPEPTWYTFASSEAAQGAVRPKLVLEYNVPMQPCVDGQITKTGSCTSCTGFTTGTSATTAVLSSDSDAPSLCARQSQMAMVFDTSVLSDNHTISTAELHFTIASQTETNLKGPSPINTRKIRVLLATTEDTCSGYTLDADDFYNCGSLTTIAVIVIPSAAYTGPVSVAITNPESNLGKTTRTRFVLVDDTTFSSSGAAHEFAIYTADHSVSGQRPELQVFYE